MNRSRSTARTVLVVDVGGTNIKVKSSARDETLKIPSGPQMTPERMVAAVLESVHGWRYDAVSIGIPASILSGRLLHEPKNLGPGWVGYDFERDFGKPVRLINDAAMQALGSYEGRPMLFLGLGTGLGSALVVEGVVMPLELAHLPYRKGRTYEDYVGKRGLDRCGNKKWQRFVVDIIQRLREAFVVDDVVLGGGNAKLLDELPPGVRRVTNQKAIEGGMRVWADRTAET